eukprot:s2152_g3.t1
MPAETWMTANYLESLLADAPLCICGRKLVGLLPHFLRLWRSETRLWWNGIPPSNMASKVFLHIFCGCLTIFLLLRTPGTTALSAVDEDMEPNDTVTSQETRECNEEVVSDGESESLSPPRFVDGKIIDSPPHLRQKLDYLLKHSVDDVRPISTTSSSSTASLSMLQRAEMFHDHVRQQACESEGDMKKLPETKWGRCKRSECGYASAPHLYQSGQYGGEIRLLCSRFWKVHDGKRLCYFSTPCVQSQLKRPAARVVQSQLKRPAARVVQSQLKRPAARGVHGRLHLCSVCKKIGHRIEKCPNPAAKLVLKLRKENGMLKEKSKRKVLRQESKHRKSPHLTGDHQKKATEMYKGKPAARLPAPAEVRRNRQDSMLHSLHLPSTEESAADWLQEHGWIACPEECLKCGRNSFSALIWSEDRPPHWRCNSYGCGCRVKIFENSIFAGLRVTALQLVKLLGHYAASNLAVSPSVPDFVQVRMM